MCEKLVIDHRRLIAVTPYRMPRSGSRVLYDRNFKALFEKFAQMGFDAYVRQHTAKDDFADPPFSQLQDQIVGLRPPDFMRADDDRLSIFNVGLKTIQPVCARVCEPLQGQRSACRSAAYSVIFTNPC